MAFLAPETTVGATIVPAGRENIIGGRIRVLADARSFGERGLKPSQIEVISITDWFCRSADNCFASMRWVLFPLFRRSPNGDNVSDPPETGKGREPQG